MHKVSQDKDTEYKHQSGLATIEIKPQSLFCEHFLYWINCCIIKTAETQDRTRDL